MMMCCLVSKFDIHLKHSSEDWRSRRQHELMTLKNSFSTWDLKIGKLIEKIPQVGFKNNDAWDQGLVKGAILCFRNLYFYFRHGESTSTASQKSKDLNKVPLLLQDPWLDHGSEFRKSLIFSCAIPTLTSQESLLWWNACSKSILSCFCLLCFTFKCFGFSLTKMKKKYLKNVFKIFFLPLDTWNPIMFSQLQWLTRHKRSSNCHQEAMFQTFHDFSMSLCQ